MIKLEGKIPGTIDMSALAMELAKLDEQWQQKCKEENEQVKSGKGKIFGMEVSLSIFETKDPKFKNSKNVKNKLSLPEHRGSAEMSKSKVSPKMLIATFTSENELNKDGVKIALSRLHEELNKNIEYLEDEFAKQYLKE